MKVLVTGATGFVGGQVTRQLLAAGHTVSALVRSPEKAAPLAEEGVTLIQGDLGDIDSLDRAMVGIDAVIHTAAQTGKLASRADHLRVSGEGTRLIAEAAARAGVKRFIHVSSIAVYRTLHGETKEEDPKGPWFAYGAGKWQGEQVLFETAARTGMEAVALRPPFVYGEGVRPTDWTRQIAAPLTKMKFLPLPLSGDFPCSWVHVETLASACVSALTADVAGEAINVHDDHDVRLADIIDLHRNMTGKAPHVLPLPARLVDAATLLPALRMTGAKLGELLQHGATFNLEKGITFSLDKAKARLPYESGRNFLETYRQALATRKH